MTTCTSTIASENTLRPRARSTSATKHSDKPLEMTERERVIYDLRNSPHRLSPVKETERGRERSPLRARDEAELLARATACLRTASAARGVTPRRLAHHGDKIPIGDSPVDSQSAQDLIDHYEFLTNKTSYPPVPSPWGTPRSGQHARRRTASGSHADTGRTSLSRDRRRKMCLSPESISSGTGVLRTALGSEDEFGDCEDATFQGPSQPPHKYALCAQPSCRSVAPRAVKHSEQRVSR